MGINGVTNASKYMSLLTPNKQQEKGTGFDFSSLLAQALDQSKGIHAEQVSNDTSPSYLNSQGPIKPFNNRTDPEYMDFWEKATSKESIKLPDEYIQYRDDGTKVNTLEGMEYLAKVRVENALTLAPPSIDDARTLYSNSYQHLDKSFNDLINKSGYDVDIRLNSTDPVSYFYGTFSCLDDYSQHMEFSQYLRNSDDYKNINGMAEETAFYGAIVSLADKDAGFKSAYEQNPTDALREYASDIVEEMSSIQLPEARGGRGGFASADQRGYFTKDPNAVRFAPGLTIAP